MNKSTTFTHSPLSANSDTNKCNNSKEIKNRTIFISGSDVKYNICINETERYKHIYSIKPLQ